MGLHRRHDHSLGQPQEPLVERALEDDRALDEMHDLVELAERIAPFSERVEPFDDQPPPLVLVGLDVRRAQGAEIAGG